MLLIFSKHDVYRAPTRACSRTTIPSTSESDFASGDNSSERFKFLLREAGLTSASNPNRTRTATPPPPTSSAPFIVAFIPGHRAFSPLHPSESDTEVENNVAFTGQSLFPIGNRDSGSCYCSNHCPSESELFNYNYHHYNFSCG
ncbi:unnamed protein product [Mucor hiemalis]